MELKISDDFTIDDIHRIREWHYEKFKGRPFEEKRTDIEKGANRVLAGMEELRRQAAESL